MSENLTHDVETMQKVWDALLKAGLSELKVIDAVTDMQNAGILFRERGEIECGETEWEYAAGYTALDGEPHPFENRGYLRFVAEADREKYGFDEAILVRRRKAGEWEEMPNE